MTVRAARQCTGTARRGVGDRDDASTVFSYRSWRTHCDPGPVAATGWRAGRHYRHHHHHHYGCRLCTRYTSYFPRPRALVLVVAAAVDRLTSHAHSRITSVCVRSALYLAPFSRAPSPSVQKFEPRSTFFFSPHFSPSVFTGFPFCAPALCPAGEQCPYSLLPVVVLVSSPPGLENFNLDTRHDIDWRSVFTDRPPPHAINASSAQPPSTRVPLLSFTAEDTVRRHDHEDEQVVAGRHGRRAVGRMLGRRQEEVESRRRLWIRRGTDEPILCITCYLCVVIIADRRCYRSVPVTFLHLNVPNTSRSRPVWYTRIVQRFHSAIAETGAVRRAFYARPPARPHVKSIVHVHRADCAAPVPCLCYCWVRAMLRTLRGQVVSSRVSSSLFVRGYCSRRGAHTHLYTTCTPRPLHGRMRHRLKSVLTNSRPEESHTHTHTRTHTQRHTHTYAPAGRITRGRVSDFFHSLVLRKKKNE